MNWILDGIIITYYPPFIEDNHKTISSSQVGVILGSLGIGVVVGSAPVAFTLEPVGRKRFLMIGSGAIILSTVLFGVICDGKETDGIFWFLSILLRLLEGMGEAAATTAVQAIIGSEFKEDKELYFGYCEASMGAGLFFGPILGQLIYTVFGFRKTFYVTAVALSIPFLAIRFFVPKRFDKT